MCKVFVRILTLALVTAGPVWAQDGLPDLSSWTFWQAQAVVGNNTSLKVRVGTPTPLRSGGFKAVVKIDASDTPTKTSASASASVQAPDLPTLFGGGGLALVEVLTGIDPAVISRETGIAVGTPLVIGSFSFLTPAVETSWLDWMANTLALDGGAGLGAHSAVILGKLGRQTVQSWGLADPCWKVASGRGELIFTVTAEDGSPLGGVTVLLVSPVAGGGPSIVSGITRPDGTITFNDPPEPDRAMLIVAPAAIPAGSLVPPGPSSTIALRDIMVQ